MGHLYTVVIGKQLAEVYSTTAVDSISIQDTWCKILNN